VLPKLAGRAQALAGESGFRRTQHAAGGRERLGHPVFQAGVTIRECPPVIALAGAPALYLAGFKAAVINVIVRDVDRVAGNIILIPRTLDNPGEHVARYPERRQKPFHAVFDLLQKESLL